MSLFDAIGGLGAIYGFDKGIERTRELGETAYNRGETAAASVAGQTEFKPFTVTSGVGGAQFDQTGGLGLTMTPEQQAIQSQLQGFGSSMFDYLGDPAAREGDQTAIMNMLTGGDVAGREADIMSRLQASVAPEQERARLQLEQRLANQGRLGVQTSMFGGTPEALALEKAIAEQQAGFGVSAMEQARAEQGQESNQRLAALQEFRNRTQLAGGLGLNALSASYQPLEALLGTLSPALQAADIAGAGQRQGAQFGSSLLQAGQEAQLKAEAAATNLQAQQIQAITNLLGGQQANSVTGQTATTGLLEGLFDRFIGGDQTTAAATPAPVEGTLEFLRQQGVI
tara:strand:- start:427 stop:1449 length:1023 start_codon:yes stop_codon:yes gene_type:complete